MIKGFFVRIKNSEFEGNNYVGNLSHIVGSTFGKMSYCGSRCSLLYVKVGKYCSIASNVKVVFGNHPTRLFVSTHPSTYSVRTPIKFSYVNNNLFEEITYADADGKYVVTIGNDVWIADGVTLLSGVNIGDGAIILAGAVVSKDVEPYSIVGGVPARKIRDRFNSNQIEYLEKLQWWDKGEEWISKNIDKFSDVSMLCNEEYNEDQFNN
ncbi:MAG: CatB-related O-acetyltransferase [Lachnospiraceae bacterium]|nr:CatB-related O-acetyltransferase [Lachnospiraceae bacterium]